MLGGIFRSLVNPVTLFQIATGPAGWASLAARTVLTSVAQQAIQQIGQQLGLPNSVINAAQATFNAATGTQGFPTNIRDAVSFLGRAGVSPALQGQIQRDANNALNDIMQSWNRSQANRLQGNGDESGAEQGGSILMRIARALGQVMDSKLTDMFDKAETLGNLGKIDQDNNARYGQLTAELQALGQEVGFLSQSMNQVIKSIGEAASTVARKS